MKKPPRSIPLIAVICLNLMAAPDNMQALAMRLEGETVNLAQHNPKPVPAQTPSKAAPIKVPSTTPFPKQKREIEKLWDWATKTVPVGILGVISISAICYGIVRWLKPQWLLLLPKELAIPLPGQGKLGLSPETMLWLKYPSRVLDRWVAENLEKHQKRFTTEIDTVLNREIYIPIHVKLDDRDIVWSLSNKELRDIFRNQDFETVCLFILGDGGSGKTSLACQIARWSMEKGELSLFKNQMLAVLIEQELGKKTLLDAIREQLPRGFGDNYIDEEFLKALLRKRRVLVIIDHISEMSDEEYEHLKEEVSETPINALVLTSRRKDKNLGRIQCKVLEPLKLEQKKLADFVYDYLGRQKKRDIFADQEDFFDVCRRLARMLEEALKSATVMLVRMYADEVIASAEHGGILVDRLPENIPELMLKYVNRLNESVEEKDRRENLEVQEDAQIVSWECLNDPNLLFEPYNASYEKVLEALTKLSEEENEKARKQDAQKRLKYLVKKLRLVQIIEPNKVRISLDSVSEYLAALHLTNYCQEQDREYRWREFFQQVDERCQNKLSIQEFLLAVHNCCEFQEKKVPEFVWSELIERANINSQELQRLERKRRIRRSISDIFDPDITYRLRACKDLGNFGREALEAVPKLLKILGNPREDFHCRQVAATSLATINPTMPVSDLRAFISRSFTILQDENKDGQVRQLESVLLCQLALSYKLFFRPLIARWEKGRMVYVLGNDFENFWENLGDGVFLEMISILGSSFSMKSEKSEGKDGIDRCEELQCAVMIQPFYIGKFPVTQAQWKAVAVLPKCVRDLTQDPSHFKGDDRPVENISWYDAVEFCQRLSQHTGHDYRLPSEVEWEYACCSGTDTPFHFGETITTDLANYDGSYPYGPGPKGEYREQTTPVWKFGVANAFGLYDMHGNVWEWTSDCWQDSDESTPSGSRSWNEAGEENKNMVLRGGCWYVVPWHCQSTSRGHGKMDFRDYGIGFRVVCSLKRTSTHR
ncbi:MAG: SUMF1/EgtB/PvdO family nonheme iron enzyme [Pleurocapsa sp. MO_226.B13]|nr:SUMF1/EgtB/PvdO family nonheme iron enzyme [Pleurocapsa sp. MO_226.B13]